MSNLKDEIYYDNNKLEIKIHSYLDNLGLKLVDPIEKFHNYFDDKRTQIIATERYSQNSSPQTVSPLQNRYLIKKKNREQKKDFVPLSISINNTDKIKSCQSWKDPSNESVFSYNNIIKCDNESKNNDENKSKQKIQPNSLSNKEEKGSDNLKINKFALKKYSSNFVNSEHKMYIQKLNLFTQQNQQIVEKYKQNSLQKYLIPKDKPDQGDMDCMEQQEEESPIKQFTKNNIINHNKFKSNKNDQQKNIIDLTKNFKQFQQDEIQKNDQKSDNKDYMQFEKPQDIDIPKYLVQTQFSRSSGPGGQNVNKVNSKAEIRFNTNLAYQWLDSETMQRLKEQQQNSINNEGILVFQSQVHRQQDQNLRDCYQKLKEMIFQASQVPKERKYEIPPETEELAKKRIQFKRNKSSIKKTRQNKFD